MAVVARFRMCSLQRQGMGRQIVLAGRQNLQMVIVAANPNDLFDAIVVRFDFLVGQRPVFLDALALTTL